MVAPEGLAAPLSSAALACLAAARLRFLADLGTAGRGTSGLLACCPILLALACASAWASAPRPEPGTFRLRLPGCAFSSPAFVSALPSCLPPGCSSACLAASFLAEAAKLPSARGLAGSTPG